MLHEISHAGDVQRFRAMLLQKGAQKEVPGEGSCVGHFFSGGEERKTETEPSFIKANGGSPAHLPSKPCSWWWACNLVLGNGVSESDVGVLARAAPLPACCLQYRREGWSCSSHFVTPRC